jgi:predicted transcriptional regulator
MRVADEIKKIIGKIRISELTKAKIRSETNKSEKNIEILIIFRNLKRFLSSSIFCLKFKT